MSKNAYPMCPDLIEVLDRISQGFAERKQLNEAVSKARDERSAVIAERDRIQGDLERFDIELALAIESNEIERLETLISAQQIILVDADRQITRKTRVLDALAIRGQKNDDLLAVEKAELDRAVTAQWQFAEAELQEKFESVVRPLQEFIWELRTLSALLGRQGGPAVRVIRETMIPNFEKNGFAVRGVDLATQETKNTVPLGEIFGPVKTSRSQLANLKPFTIEPPPPPLAAADMVEMKRENDAYAAERRAKANGPGTFHNPVYRYPGTPVPK